MNSDLIIRLIEQKIKAMGMTDYIVEPVIVDVSSIDKTIDFQNSFYLLTSDKIDVTDLTVISLIADNYNMNFTRSEYMNLKYANRQIFENRLRIKTNNNGESFSAYQLEFLKVHPV